MPSRELAPADHAVLQEVIGKSLFHVRRRMAGIGSAGRVYQRVFLFSVKFKENHLPRTHL